MCSLNNFNCGLEKSGLSRRAHNAKNLGSNPRPATNLLWGSGMHRVFVSLAMRKFRRGRYP